ncbi:MAG: hypothetical protein PHC99_05015 [Methylococcales bacterium]|nr:hypothetical protein [Methylococcales bacterium]
MALLSISEEQRKVYNDEQQTKYATLNSYYCCEAKSKEVLARKFLTNLLGFDARSANFQTLFDKYKEKTNRCNLPTNEQEFYQFIFNVKLGLEKLPRETLTDLYFSAMQDINFINEELKKLEAKKKNLETKKKGKQRFNEEDFCSFNMIEHYKKKNISAKEEITTFLTGEKIRNLAAKQSIKHSAILYSYRPAPYRYAQKRSWQYNGYVDYFESFNIDDFNEFSHKFSYIETDSEPEKYEQLYSLKDEPTKFDELAKWYIGKYEIIEKIKALFSKSHFLHDRKELFNTLLTHYEKREFITFNYIVPLQIEGLFNDLCLALEEIDDSEINAGRSPSLNQKLKYIETKLFHCHFYEYFAFKFPIIRNNVAHGRILDDNHESLAQNLLLDFHSICEMFVSSYHIPVMRSLSLLKEIENSIDTPPDDLFNQLVEWFMDFSKIEIPEFYEEADALKKSCIARYESEEFWGWLNSIKEHGNRYFDSDEIQEFAGLLKHKGIAVEQCVSFLRN